MAYRSTHDRAGGRPRRRLFCARAEAAGGSALYVAEAGTGGTLRCVPLRGASACVASRRRSRVTATAARTGSWRVCPPTRPSRGRPRARLARTTSRSGTGYAVIGLATPVALRPALGERFGWTVGFDARL